MPTLFHGVYGLGSKDFNKYDAAAVVENMLSFYEKKRRFQRDFYVGIEGPMTLRPTPLPGYLERELGMTFIGVGAEGVKTALESAALDLCPGHRHGQEIHPVRGPLRRRPQRRPGVHEPAHLRPAHPQQFGIDRTGRPGLLQ